MGIPQGKIKEKIRGYILGAQFMSIYCKHLQILVWRDIVTTRVIASLFTIETENNLSSH